MQILTAARNQTSCLQDFGHDIPNYNCQFVWIEQAYNLFCPSVWLLVHKFMPPLLYYTRWFSYICPCFAICSGNFPYVPIFSHAMSTSVSDVVNHPYGFMGEIANLRNFGDCALLWFNIPFSYHQITIKSLWKHHQITLKSPSNHHHHRITIKSALNHH